MRILYIAGDPSIGLSDNTGYTRHITECVHALRQLGHDVRLITANDDGVAGQQKRLFGKAKRAMPLMISALLKDTAKVVFDRRFHSVVEVAIEEFQPDMVYNRYALFHRSAVETARRKGVPSLLEVNASLKEADKYFGLGLRSLAARAEKSIFQSSDAVLVVSETLKSELIDIGVAPEKLYVNPNGVNPDRFSPAVDGSMIRKQYGLEDRIVVGFVGSPTPWSGAENVIDSAAIICPRYPQVSFLIVGSGDLHEMLKQKVRDFGIADRVVFTGKVPMDEAPLYLSALDIATVPYSNPEREQFIYSPIKLYESMAAGRAIVASRVAQIASVLEDGVTGLLVTPGDTGDLADKILHLLDNPQLREDMGSRAREVVLKNHTWRGNAERILNVYSALTKGKDVLSSASSEIKA